MTVSAPAYSRRLVAVLLGNPNTGKTTLFNALSGLNHRVGNYPGVTVESKKAQMTCADRIFDLVDLPGTYSLAPRSPDEMVTVDVILGNQAGESRPDVVVCIADASNLERNLYLMTQAMELGVPVVVALNMIDVAQQQGVHIDVPKLSAQLGVPVVPIQANRKKGLEELRKVIAQSAATNILPTQTPTFPPVFNQEVESLKAELGDSVPVYLVRRLLLDVGGYTEQRLIGSNGLVIRDHLLEARHRLLQAGSPVPAVEARARYSWIREAMTGCVERPKQRPITWTDRLDALLTHRIWGTGVFMLVMFLVFQSIYTAAKPLMKWIDLGKGTIAEMLSNNLPPGPFTNLLTEGVIGGVGAVVIFLPQILILFLFIALLEDCGYMARAAFLMDRLMSRCGLSGKSFIPLLSSLACAVPGIMSTRVIEDRRDRLATILVAPLMSCSARLPVYILLIGTFLTDGYPFWLPGLVMFALYALGLILAPLVALALKRTLLRGQTPLFVLEMPAYKWPETQTVVRRVLESGWAFLRRAGTVILASMILVWVLLQFPARDYPERLAELQAKGEVAEEEVKQLQAEWKRNSFLGQVGKTIEPVVRPLGWDWRVTVAAMASFPAREIFVSTLGLIYQQGEVDLDEIRESGIWGAGSTGLGRALRDARWDHNPEKRVFTLPTALSLLVFFALCCQCASTLAIIRRETQSWFWPGFTFVYMTTLAYVGAFLVYSVGTFIGL